VAGPGSLLSGTVENGMREGLGGFFASGAGRWGIIVPGGVGAEVALPRPYLLEATRVELVKAHERVGFQPGPGGVPGRVRCGLL